MSWRRGRWAVWQKVPWTAVDDGNLAQELEGTSGQMEAQMGLAGEASRAGGGMEAVAGVLFEWAMNDGMTNR